MYKIQLKKQLKYNWWLILKQLYRIKFKNTFGHTVLEW